MSGPHGGLSGKEICDAFEQKVAEEVEQQLITHRRSSRVLNNVEQSFSEMEGRLALFMKRQRNNCAPINGLSDELILEILKYCNDHEDIVTAVSKANIFRLPPAYSLCWRWRKLAVSCPSLWTSIALPSNPNFFRLLRDRSGTLPLTILFCMPNLDPEGQKMNQAGDTLRLLAPRIARLFVVWAGSRSLHEFLTSCIGQKSLGSLLTLSIISHNPSRVVECELNTPLLRELRFVGALGDIPGVSAERLVKLFVRAESMELAKLLPLLDKFPMLETLEIENTIMAVEPDVPDNLPNVALHNLRNLSAKWFYVSEMGLFLDHLTIPSSARASLGVKEDNRVDFHVGDFVGAQMSTAHGLSITGKASHLLYTVFRECGGSMPISYEALEPTAAGVKFLVTLASYATPLQLLSLRIPALPHIQDLIQALTSWPSIKHIRVCTDETEFERLLLALEETPHIVCPRLEILDCSGTYFSTARVRGFLAFRKEHGHPLRELRITEGWAEPDAAVFASLVDTNPALTIAFVVDSAAHDQAVLFADTKASCSGAVHKFEHFVMAAFEKLPDELNLLILKGLLLEDILSLSRTSCFLRGLISSYRNAWTNTENADHIPLPYGFNLSTVSQNLLPQLANRALCISRSLSHAVIEPLRSTVLQRARRGERRAPYPKLLNVLPGGQIIWHASVDMIDFYTVESGKLVGSVGIPSHVLIGWGSIDDCTLKLGVISSREGPGICLRLQTYIIEFRPVAVGQFSMRVSNDAAFDLPEIYSVSTTVPHAVHLEGPLVLVDSYYLILVINVGLGTGVILKSEHGSDVENKPQLTDFIAVGFHRVLQNQLIATQVTWDQFSTAYHVVILDLPSILFDENPASTAAGLASPSHDTVISWTRVSLVWKRMCGLSAKPEMRKLRYSHRHEEWVYDFLLADDQYLCLSTRTWKIISPHSMPLEVKHLQAVVSHQGSGSRDMSNEPNSPSRVDETHTVCERWETMIRFPEEFQGESPDDNWWRLMAFDPVYGVAIAMKQYNVDIAVFQF
ncbi:hypothetical protein SISNIDRAFT_482934 [Sistotremastrum niveocremeum HHB9708]|uniref:F-box domain-containing protein n=1 Tax=Sistotremastrum niveocremeum HHB9708 TaxID=1314777 RepID=A0A164XWI2_9AGAM|nr:hypothetical protein SISNIDRAFT_482934 [Sistotremastrum niveocremeum HHB9708]